MRTRYLLVLAAALAVALTGCGGGEKAADGGGDGDANRMVIAATSSPTNLDPRVGNDNVSGRIFDLCCRGLIRVTPEMDYAPDLATNWETPDDKTIIFHLNPNAKFHDGRPVTAQDVKWTYESVINQTVQNTKASGYSAVDRIEAPDAKTVILHLREPNGGLFDNLNMGIVPAGSDANAMKSKPVSSGPYKVIEYRTDEAVELEAFDGWHHGVPKIKRLTVRTIPDETTRVLELRRGSIDFEVNAIPFESVKEFETSAKHQVVKKPGSVWQYLALISNIRFSEKSKCAARSPTPSTARRSPRTSSAATAYRPTPCSARAIGSVPKICRPIRTTRRGPSSFSIKRATGIRTARARSRGSRSRSRRRRVLKPINVRLPSSRCSSRSAST